MTTSERNALIESAMPVIRAAARILSKKDPAHIEYDEACSVGCLAVLERFDSFDAARSKFRQFAHTVARQGILRHYGLGCHTRRDPMTGRRGSLFFDRDEDSPREERYASAYGDPEALLLRAESEARVDAALDEASPADVEMALTDPKVMSRNPAFVAARRAAATRIYLRATGEEPVSVRRGRAGGAERSARWYAALSPEKKAARVARRKVLRAQAKARRAA